MPQPSLTERASTAYYFAMRLLRKTVFPVAVPRAWRRFIPGMRKNFGAISSSGVVGLYNKHLAPIDPEWIPSRTILEVGIGETNSSCYELAARGAAKCYALEPFVPLHAATDAELLNRCAQQHGVSPANIAGRVERVTDIRAIPDQSVDLALSNSVLEHVSDPDALAAELKRVLKERGAMLHIVDYRDHFFTFPYHHLLWSDQTWNRFLNPGDLPRWRIGDHVKAFGRAGLEVKVLLAKPVPQKFQSIRKRIHPRFAGYSEEDLSTAYGVLYVTRRG